jgi:hypothetical protein
VLREIELEAGPARGTALAAIAITILFRRLRRSARAMAFLAPDEKATGLAVRAMRARFLLLQRALEMATAPEWWYPHSLAPTSACQGMV